MSSLLYHYWCNYACNVMLFTTKIDYTITVIGYKKLHVSLFQTNSLFLTPKQKTIDVGWPRIEDFQLQGHSCVNNVQHCLCHLYTRMRHSKQTATLLLTKRHANFDTLTRSAKGHACIRTAHAQL